MTGDETGTVKKISLTLNLAKNKTHSFHNYQIYWQALQLHMTISLNMSSIHYNLTNYKQTRKQTKYFY